MDMPDSAKTPEKEVPCYGPLMRSEAMSYHCPLCETCIENETSNDPLLVRCPECGADLYPEEVIFQQMISGTDNVAA